jgi:streptomycin 6-kinase
MPRAPLAIPVKVRRKAWALGDAGRAWLTVLPKQISDIERHWGIAVGLPSPNGSEAFVAEVRTDDGQDAVLKICVPGLDPTRQELRVLRAANGRGYAKLLRADTERNILLLEKLGPQLHALGWPEDRQLEAIVATLRDAWMPLPEGPAFVTGAEKAAELATFIGSNWSTLERPCSERAVDAALAYAERRRRAFDPRYSVLAHGDAHQWNTLQAPDSRTGFKLVDPDGAFAERAFDLAIPMREWVDPVPAPDRVRRGRRRCALLARLAGVDPAPIWEWSLPQCVSNGLLLRQLGADAAAASQLAMAEAWAEAGDWVASQATSHRSKCA